MKNDSRFYLIISICLSILVCNPLQAGWFDKVQEVIKSNRQTSSLSENQVGEALKQALSIGSENVVQQLSAPGGFNSDANIHIPLPTSLQTMQKTMNKFGVGSSLNSLENKLNEAAEIATEKARPLFLAAIKNMSWDDAKTILNGPDDAATQYFKSKMSAPLNSEMKPIVDETLNQVGAISTYNNAIGKYKSLPLVPDVHANLNEYVLDKSISGIFYYLAKEEKAIREDPAKRTTDLLKKVFAN